MNLIGYWIRDLRDEQFCAPQEVVGWLAPDVRDRVAEYLDTGKPYMWCAGLSWCRFFCSANRGGVGANDLTDGIWGWPQGLSHYVRAHDVALPEEFIAHALAHKEGAPPIRPNEVLSLGDYRLWTTWCAKRRSPAFLERLRGARQVASVRAREVSERVISEKLEKHGVSREKCLFAGCGQRALRGMKLCVVHALRDEPARRASSCYAITKEFMAGSVFGRAEAVET
jgi:hypothetical protein